MVYFAKYRPGMAHVLCKLTAGRNLKVIWLLKKTQAGFQNHSRFS